MLPAVGWTTASANAVATAASTAVPPSLIMSAPIFDAISFCDATMPFCARIGTEPAPIGIDQRLVRLEDLAEPRLGVAIPRVDVRMKSPRKPPVRTFDLGVTRAMLQPEDHVEGGRESHARWGFGLLA